MKKPMKISCLTCHQPHSSAKADLLVKDQENNMAFCNTCHAQKPAGNDKAEPTQKSETTNTKAQGK